MSDPVGNNRNWWRPKAGSKNVHDTVVAQGQYLRRKAVVENFRDKVIETFYESEELLRAPDWREVLRAAGYNGGSINVMQDAIDTLVARIGKKRPAIKVKATDADYKLKRKARDLTRFIIGEQEDMRTDTMRPQLTRDTMLAGTGVSRVYSEGTDIKMDRVRKRQIFIDPREGRHGKPRQMFFVEIFAREVLMERYPESAEAIRTAPDAQVEDWSDSDGWSSDSDMVEVWMAWHLPSGPEAKDGRHVVCLPGVTLVHEDWTAERFPFAFMRYIKPQEGFWGKSLAGRLMGMQRTLDTEIRGIIEDNYIGGRLKIFQRKGSSTPKSHLGRNRGVAIIDVDQLAGDITYVAPDAIGPRRLEFVRWWIDMIYQRAGVSPQAAGARNPLSGDASGIARQEFWDWESERHAEFEKNAAEWDLQVAEICIDEARRMAEDKRIPKARWSERDVMQIIDWKSVDMKKDQYALTLEPSNFLPETRAGKIQASEMLAKLGALAPDKALYLLRGYPDLERANLWDTSTQRYIEHLIEMVEDEDIQLAECIPDGHVSLDTVIVEVTKAYLSCLADSAPDGVQERFRQFLEQQIAEKQKQDKIAAQLAPPPAPDMMGGAPGMPPAPAPTSMGQEGMGLPGLAAPGTGNETPMPVM